MENHEIASAIASKVSYTASGTLIALGFSLSDFTLIFGMVLGLATFFLNWFYKHKSLKLLKDIEDEDE